MQHNKHAAAEGELIKQDGTLMKSLASRFGAPQAYHDDPLVIVFSSLDSWFNVHATAEIGTDKMADQLENVICIPGSMPVHLMAALWAAGWKDHHSGNYGAAKRLFHSVYKTCKDTFGPDFPGTVLCMEGVATCLYDEGKPAAAVTLFEQALPKRKRLHGDWPLQLAISLKRYALALQAVGRHEDAVATLQEASTVLSEDPDSPSAAAESKELMALLSQCYMRADGMASADDSLQPTVHKQRQATSAEP